MNKLLCFFNIHDWKYSGPEFETQLSLDLDIPERPATRECICCGKKQTMYNLSINLYTGSAIKAWKTDK